MYLLPLLQSELNNAPFTQKEKHRPNYGLNWNGTVYTHLHIYSKLKNGVSNCQRYRSRAFALNYHCTLENRRTFTLWPIMLFEIIVSVIVESFRKEIHQISMKTILYWPLDMISRQLKNYCCDGVGQEDLSRYYTIPYFKSKIYGSESSNRYREVA